MPFSWLESTKPRPDGHEARTKVAAAELAQRAGLLYRLGISEADATQRLCARLAWEYEPTTTTSVSLRPDALSDQAIATIVADTYARRPG